MQTGQKHRPTLFIKVVSVHAFYMLYPYPYWFVLKWTDTWVTFTCSQVLFLAIVISLRTKQNHYNSSSHMGWECYFCDNVHDNCKIQLQIHLCCRHYTSFNKVPDEDFCLAPTGAVASIEQLSSSLFSTGRKIDTRSNDKQKFLFYFVWCVIAAAVFYDFHFIF